MAGYCAASARYRVRCSAAARGHENRAAWSLELYLDLPEEPQRLDDAKLLTFTSTTSLVILPEPDVASLPPEVAARTRARAAAGGLALLETR